MKVISNLDIDLFSGLDYLIKLEFYLPRGISAALDLGYVYIRIANKLYEILGRYNDNICVKEVGSYKREEFVHPNTTVYTSFDINSARQTNIVNKYYSQSG